MKVTILVTTLALFSNLSFAQSSGHGPGNSSVNKCPLSVFIEEDGRLPNVALTQIEAKFKELGYKVTDKSQSAYFTYSLPQSLISSDNIRLDASFSRNRNGEILYMGIYAEGRFMNLFSPSQSPKAWQKKVNALMRRIGPCGSETKLVDKAGSPLHTIKFY